LKFDFKGITNQGEIENIENFSLILFTIKKSSNERAFYKKLNYEEFKALTKNFQTFLSLEISEDEITKSASIKKTYNSQIIDIIKEFEDISSDLLREIFIKISDENLRTFLCNLNSEEIKNLRAITNQTLFSNEIENLKKLILLEEQFPLDNDFKEKVTQDSNLKKYYANQGEKIFENWILLNLWIFDLEYSINLKDKNINQFNIKDTLKEGVNKRRKNFPDFVMKNINTFLNLIEIKLPKAELFKYDKSHKSYHNSYELSKAIGQCINYLDILDNKVDKEKFQEYYKCKLKRPKIKLIIGKINSEGGDIIRENLRNLNFHLNQIEVITYSDLISQGERIINSYNEISS
jgi:hypothetical protein